MRRNRPLPSTASGPTIDIHAHHYPDAYLKLIEDAGEPLGYRVNRDDSAGPTIQWGAGRIGPLRPEFFDFDRRRREMDRQGVRVHALSLTLPMVDWCDGELGARLARLTNDAFVQAHIAFPDRFLGLAALPWQDVTRALEELDRVARLPGMRGVYAGTNIAGRDLSAPELFPVYERIQALRWPLFLHPYNTLGGQRLKPWYLHNLLGNPFDTATAAAHLIFGGVMDRFPRLTVCLPHGGGALPWLIGRMAAGWKKVPDCKVVRRSPRAYLHRFVYDTITHDPDALAYLLRQVGATRVMLGSDYCFNLGYDRPVQMVARLRGISAADRQRILGGNAGRLLRRARS